MTKQTGLEIICKERINFEEEACPCSKNGRMQGLISFDANAPSINFLGAAAFFLSGFNTKARLPVAS